ncbi:hypothetical protein TREMEDRAFT_63466 [Tremella mesenterica DSM 1558]|uniref:uncharacterized protein n=1 Tax=Tremella mesenterica (strain ATCC 24925 / CBS 8224 / DSM 1558 / NBRC 9311 / NRRL Y-6157 / RJB 2259-6 / UBC 559-6) TaxID=578456 RepID=UPI0003F48E07|nr:uncharacterized protein TREMEDRAFT_63466 [Tremella mesenterica DSM 1558]EIW68294.1 hypothetical protein TREMEDRAFT_63466 [Tremella mesenterica DSM 1558]
MIQEIEYPQIAAAEIQHTITQYLDLINKLDTFIRLRADGQNSQKSQFEIGAGIWMDAEVAVKDFERGRVDLSPDISTVLVDIGLGLRVEMDLKQASEMAQRRTSEEDEENLNSKILSRYGRRRIRYGRRSTRDDHLISKPHAGLGRPRLDFLVLNIPNYTEWDDLGSKRLTLNCSIRSNLQTRLSTARRSRRKTQ